LDPSNYRPRRRAGRPNRTDSPVQVRRGRGTRLQLVLPGSAVGFREPGEVSRPPARPLVLRLIFRSQAAHKPDHRLFICLEALLLQGKEELTFRLASRVANLLGPGAEDRKALFREIRSLYNVRSKVVHGEVLRPGETDLVQQVDKLRETARRVILSSVSLRTEVGPRSEFLGLGMLFRVGHRHTFLRRLYSPPKKLSTMVSEAARSQGGQSVRGGGTVSCSNAGD
jgi:Apea-like HEPN